MRTLEESVKEEKSQADKMFEELGFNMDPQIKNSYYKHQLEIDFIDKDIIIRKTDYDLNGDIHSDTVYLNDEIIKAIYLKCKELGVIMCKYCENEKRIEERENDNIHLSIYGKHLRILGKIPMMHVNFGRDVIIEFCPMCGRKLGE